MENCKGSCLSFFALLCQNPGNHNKNLGFLYKLSSTIFDIFTSFSSQNFI